MNNAVDDGSNTTLPDATATAATPAGVHWIGQCTDPVRARIEGPEGTVHLVTKDRVAIGRQSTSKMPDIAIENNNYVSREHLVLERVEDSSRWQLTCNGKNGIFLNTLLMKKTENGAIPLPARCTLRFPSTELSYDIMFVHAPPADSTPPPPTHTSTTGVDNDSGFVSPSKDELANGGTDDKPPYSYAQLITQAIAASPDRKCTLSGIYSYITRNYAWYGTRSDNGWQNSVRHNLSLNKQFVRVQRDEPQAANKGSFWRLDGDARTEQELLASAFTKRQAKRSAMNGMPTVQTSSGKSKDADGAGATATNGVDRKTESASNNAGSNESQNNHASAHSNGSDSDGMFKKDVSSASLMHTTQSAPSSPTLHQAQSAPISAAKHVTDTAETVAIQMGFPPARSQRETHPSGGSQASTGGGSNPGQAIGQTFRVSTSTKDGRNRLQLCHSPPEFVSVGRSDISALTHLSARNRQNYRALLERYRGGSKSLSTTPVRDLINEPTFVRQLLSPDPKTSASNPRKRRNESGSRRRAGESSSQSQTPVQRSPMASPTQRATLESEQRALLQKSLLMLTQNEQARTEGVQMSTSTTATTLADTIAYSQGVAAAAAYFRDMGLLPPVVTAAAVTSLTRQLPTENGHKAPRLE